jgi:small multidrug resistance pump
MQWLILVLAICFEVSGTLSLKLSEGLTKLVPSVFMFIFYTASVTTLSFVVRRLDVGVAYAVWSGVGSALITTIGIVYFKEPATPAKLLCIALIIAGAIGLNLITKSH